MSHRDAFLPSVQRKSCRVKKGETESEVQTTVTRDIVWEKSYIIQTKTKENGEK